MQSEKEILLLSLKDLFTTKMIKYSILPFILSMLVLYALFFLVAGAGLDSLGSMQVESSETTIVNGIPDTNTVQATLEGSAIIQFLMSHAITSWIATFLVYTVGTLITLYFSIFVALIIVGLLTPTILKEIQKRHYPDVEIIGYSNIISALFSVIRWASIMLLMFIVFVPLYFIPIINIIAFNLPLYYFFHKMITFDVASTICNKDEAMKIKFFNETKLRLKTLALYFISLIPFVVFFASVFYIIYLGHTYFIETKKLREL